jgi:hypothetical protein
MPLETQVFPLAMLYQQVIRIKHYLRHTLQETQAYLQVMLYQQVIPTHRVLQQELHHIRLHQV